MIQARGIPTTLIALAILVTPAFIPFANARVWPLSQLDEACGSASEACAPLDGALDAACSQAQGGCETLNATGADPQGTACAAASQVCAVLLAPPGETLNAFCSQFDAGQVCDTVNQTDDLDPQALACGIADDACAVLLAPPGQQHNAFCDRYAQDACQQVNDTQDTDPQALACGQASAVCAVLDAPPGEQYAAFCDQFDAGEACEAVNATVADPTWAVCERSAQACAVLLAPPGEQQDAFCDQIARDACEQANATTQDPSGAACAASGHEPVCAGVEDAVADRDPNHVVEGACSDGHSGACAAANETGPTLIATVLKNVPNAVNMTESIVIVSPTPNSWSPKTIPLEFETTLPQPGDSPFFFVQVAQAGTSDWQTIAEVSCIGTVDAESRTCAVNVAHALNGEYALRVAAASVDACTLNECAWVAGTIHLDTVAPTSALGELPSTVFASVSQIAIPYTVEEQGQLDSVQLHYAKDGVEHLSDAQPQDGAFAFPVPEEGTYDFWTVAADKAGNVEDVSGKVRTSVTFVHTLSVDVPDTFVTDGQHAIVRASVTQNGVAVPAEAVVVATFRGTGYAMTSEGDGLWSADLGPISVPEAQNETVHVAAGLEDAAGALDGIVVLSPSRLVYLSAGTPDYVASAADYAVSLHAAFADTGAAADRLHVVAKDGAGNVLAEDYVWSTGDLILTLPSPGAAEAIDVTLTATELGQGAAATPATLAPQTFQAVWTDLVGTLDAMDHATGWADSGLPFGLTYCVHFAHDASPLVGGFVSVADAASDEVFQGTTGADGCVPVYVTEDDGQFSFTANVAATPDVGDMISNDVAGTVDLVFTKVSLDLATDVPAGHYVNLEDPAGFGVCAEYTYLAGAPAAGAIVRLVDDAGATLEEATLDAAGCAPVQHVFHDVYAGSVSLSLVSTPQLVTLQVGPTPLDGIVATEVVVGQITATDTFADWNQTVTYTLPLTWAHDGSALAQADVTLDGGACSPVSGGAVTCSVTRSGDADATFSPTLSTGQGVTRIHDAAAVATPETVWTAVVAEASVTDALVEVGDAPVVSYAATYTYDGSPVPAFTVRFSGGCGIGEDVQGADGLATLAVSSAAPCQTPIAAALVATDEGIVTQTNPSLATPNVVWTGITLDPAVDDAIATLGQAVVVSGTATYGVTGANVPSANLIVTDDDGAELAAIPILDGAFSGTVSKSVDYNGKLHFEVVDGADGVNAADPVTVDAAWTHVALTVVADKTLASVATPIHLDGTASYALGLGNVATGTIEIQDAGGNVVATAAVADGAWSADVTLPDAYNARLTAHVAASDQGVEGVDEETPVLTWTSIALALTAPDDLFVDVGGVIGYDVAATYAYDGTVHVADADLTAYADDGTTVLGTCHVVDGACRLDLASPVSYAGGAHVVVTREGNGVLAQSAPVVTAPLVWTRLVIAASAPTLPANVGSAVDVSAAVTYEHNGQPVPNALVTVSGLSPGSQYGYTDASGHVVIHAYETQAGARTLTVAAQDGAQGIAAMQAPGSVGARWTAIGFKQFTYDVAPTSVDASGNPTFAVGARVTVCSVATPVDDAAAPLAGAKVLLRGASRTTDASGSACLTLTGPSAPGSVKFTAHGVSATVDGAPVTASSDRSVTIYFAS